ncbi:hypothetical protein R3W88_003909 [Solanum pinnatisectum]|uniref:Uncharacterized protein n=1 Tax=Solanum pinnatisectum TaxID=50273 RepID=A0AAV9MQR7_9SOLN|nr:hypothetical protein R3W88_003909 [Solanum pinnatisectum]
MIFYYAGARDHSIWKGIHVVHDGLVYKRFSVGSVANVHYLRKLRHSEKFNGVPLACS